MKKVILFLLLAVVSFAANAGIVDHDKMYNAYLQGDLKTWHDELLKYVKNNNTSFTDRREIANYLYGYIGFISEDKSKKSTCEYFMKFFERYYEEMIKSPNHKALGLAYKAAAYGMKSKYEGNTLINGPKTISYLNDAEKADSKNPIVIGFRGTTKLYAPAILGGDKKKALSYFLKAVKILGDNTPTVFRWNYRALQLCIVETYLALGQETKADEWYKKIMAEEPKFKRLEIGYELGNFGITDVK